MTAMSTDTDTTGSAVADAVSAPLDLLLTDAAFGALGRVNPGGFGHAEAQPSRPDRRFTDSGWIGNPLLGRVVQAHLAAAQRFPTAETRRG